MRFFVLMDCEFCGGEIVVPVDLSAGQRQEYVEDCPVCCHPMTLRVEVDDDGIPHKAEQKKSEAGSESSAA